MHRETIYKIIIGVLAVVVIILAGILIFRKPPRAVPAKITKVTKAIKGRVAIVIDDLGYNLDNLHVLEEIKYPLTLSILPNLSYSKDAAEKLHQRGFEIILHLPMEPHEKARLENNTILTSMDESRIREIIETDLSSISYARGVSNHMGSLATEDMKIMDITFAELKNKGLYFLDSFVTGNSIAMPLAQKSAVRFARRDVFLDNNLDDKYIRQQIYRLKIKARLKGQAVGIGHDRKLTLKVLKEVMPEISQEGYKFVFVSELVR